MANRVPIDYMQTDSRWGGNKYATKGETSTIKSAGCGITCAAMVIATLSDSSVTPATTAKWSMDHGYKAYHQGTYYSYFKPQMAAYGITCEQMNGSTVYHGANSAKTINERAANAVRNGNWVIACMGKGDWTSSGHFVLWYDIDADGYALIRDPYSTKSTRRRAPVSKLQYQAKFYFEVKVPGGSGMGTTPNASSLADQIASDGGKFVIDVSAHNGSVDWTRVKVDGAIIRLGYRGYGQGTLTMDKQFDANVQGCIKNNIAFGVYWFTTALNEAEGVEEAEYVLSAVKNLKLYFPIFIDTEYSNAQKSGRSDSLGKAARTKAVRAFCERIQKAGYCAGVYASESWLKDMVDVDQLPYRYWIANYSRRPTYHNFDGWQRTSSGRVNGVSTNVDVSEWLSERVIYDPKFGEAYEESYYDKVLAAAAVPATVVQEDKPDPPPIPSSGGSLPGEWSKDARDWAASNGIVLGDGVGIDWSAKVTMEQLVTILHRIHKGK